MKQIVWVRAVALNTPNDQRAEIIKVDKQHNIHVLLLGTNKATTITTRDIIGFDIPLDDDSGSISIRL